MRRIVLAIILVCAASRVDALTAFYLDPDVAGGTHVGTQANPFNTLGSAQWTGANLINAALATDDVVVYCSARAAGSDTNQVTSFDIEGWRKTPNPGHRFTLDGTSFWNSNDTTPNWTAYSGSSKCQANRYNTQDRSSNSQLINDWTINGMLITSTLPKILSICGNNVIIQNSEIFQAVGTSSSNTPMVLITPVADAIREGSSAACPRMTNGPTFTNNYIHDSSGELIYGGNGGCRFNDTNGFDPGSGATFDITRGSGTYTVVINAIGSGYVINQKLFVLGTALGGSNGSCCGANPTNNDLLITITSVDGSGGITGVTWAGTSTGAGTNTAQAPTNNCMGMSATTGHQNATFTGNMLTLCGSRGAQGDCMDFKGGWVHVLISQNHIDNNADLNNDFRCIVTQGVYNDGTDQDFIIERNDIHDCLGVSQGAVTLADSWGEPNGFILRNNLIRGTTGGNGFHINSSQSSPGIKVYSTVFYNNSGNCIAGSAMTVTVTNTICLSNNGSGAQISGSTFTADHNSFNGTWAGTCTSCQSSLSASAGVDLVNPAAGDFHVVSTSTKLVDKGASIASFANDYIGTVRPQGSSWDIGAYELITASAAPQRYRFLRSIPGLFLLLPSWGGN